MAETLQDLRLRVKREFASYYLALCSPQIADPTAAFDAIRLYLSSRREALGAERFRDMFEEDVEGLAGEIEQDLRQRHKDLGACFEDEPIDARLWESVAQSWGESPGT
jgi:hypothetical protein